MAKTLHYATPEKSGVRTFIAFPAYSGISPGVGFSLFKSASEIDSYMELHFLTEYCHVDDARNTIVNTFLESSCDQLVFIDSDTYWEPDDLRRLMEFDKDIVAGVVPKKADGEFNVKLKNLDIKDGLLEVDGIGTAFMKIRRNVLEDLARDAETFLDPTHKSPIHVIFERSLAHGRRVGGDINFCYKAQAKGYKVFVSPDMKFGHYGENYWEGRFIDHLCHEKGSETPKFIEAVDRLRAGESDNDVFMALYEHWGNKNWSAAPDLLMASYFIAKEHKRVLETGSGLSTIVMALAGCKVYALEHDWTWYNRVKSAIKQLGLDAEVIYAPIKDYGKFAWYDYKDLPKPVQYDLMLIDGPPQKIGRDSVFRIFDVNNATVIMDDRESAIIDGHESIEIKGIKPFVIARPACKKCA